MLTFFAPCIDLKRARHFERPSGRRPVVGSAWHVMLLCLYTLMVCFPAGSERGACPGNSTITGTGESTDHPPRLSAHADQAVRRGHFALGPGQMPSRGAMRAAA